MDVNTEVARIAIELANEAPHLSVPKLLAMGPVAQSDVYTMLFVQPDGEFFAIYEPRYKGEAHIIEALTREQARTMFEKLPASNADFATCLAAFGS